MRFVLVVFVSLALGSVTLVVVNHYFLANAFEPPSLSVDAFILLFVLFAAWTVLSLRRRVLIVVPATLLFVIALGAYLIAASGPARTRDDAILRNLASLPYLSVVPGDDSDRTGVLYHNEELAYNGINMYNARSRPATYLMDMSGKILHSWEVDISGVGNWTYSRMLPNGDLLDSGTTVCWSSSTGNHTYCGRRVSRFTTT